MPRLLPILPLLLFSILGLLFFKGMSLDPASLPSPLLNQPLPAFSLADLDDPARSLSQTDVRGPALLNFWASWCAACRDEQALLLDLARNSGVAVYGIDYLDQRSEAQEWLKHFGDPYTRIGFDPQGRLGALFRLLGTPETYLVDGNGIVRYRHVGALTREAWTAMQATLNGGVPPVPVPGG